MIREPDGIVELRDYVDARLRDHCDKNELWQAAHLREHALQERAEDHAREALVAKLETMNEFRSQILSERSCYMTRTEYESKYEALGFALTNEKERHVLQLGSLESNARMEREKLSERQTSFNTWLRVAMAMIIILLVGVIVDLVMTLAN